MASGNLGAAVFVDAVLLVLTFIWAIVGSVLTNEGVWSIRSAWTLGPFFGLVLVNMFIVLFAYVTSRLR
jgi:hypothetical protein